LTSAAAAVVLGLTLFDAAPIDAAPKRQLIVRKAKKGAPKRITKAPRTITKAPATHKHPPKATAKAPFKGPAARFAKKTTIGKGALNLRSLPVHKKVAGTKLLSGRLAVPKQIKPKLSLVHVPHAKIRPRFAPFIQRHWKQAFFWVAIAGIGYITIPQLYYDPFYSCVDGDDPIYEDCLYILSYAALEEEEYVHISMPEKAAYRFEAKAPAKEACPSCSWDPFVQRRWNQPYSWVRIPQVGSVTVPDAYYDRFYTYAGATPPNYPQACQVLQEAASASDESKLERLGMPAGTKYRYEAETNPTERCRACTLRPFVERKWNRAFVWVQIPQTGNVTVPEDTYDSFYRHASAEPPNYQAACKVLVEAAASDTVMTAAPVTGSGVQ
jgi:hypothetical protein